MLALLNAKPIPLGRLYHDYLVKSFKLEMGNDGVQKKLNRK
jgi:hypothetical protein